MRRWWFAGVITIALVGLLVSVAGAIGVFEPNDGLWCGSTTRGGAVIEHAPDAPGAPTADEAILRSEIPEFHDIPRSAWRLVEPVGFDQPEDGIILLGPRSDRRGAPEEYLVFVDGKGVMRVSVELSENGYLIGGWGSC